MAVFASAVFVYGTLLPGEERWPLLEPFVGGWQATTVRGALYDTGYGYPALVLDEDADGEVPGMLVDLDPERLVAAVRNGAASGAPASSRHVSGAASLRSEPRTRLNRSWAGP